MQMKQLKAQVKKYFRSRKTSRMRNAIGGLAIVLILMIVIGVAMVASPPSRDNAAAQAARIAENKKAQLELQSSADTGAPAAAFSDAVTVKPASSTVTGCLQQREDGFRLKDAGGDVPRGRSWKSGFLKKSTPQIDVIDASHHLKLKDHVGQRVSVTGVLVDREMRARSLQRVAVTCS